MEFSLAEMGEAIAIKITNAILENASDTTTTSVELEVSRSITQIVIFQNKMIHVVFFQISLEDFLAAIVKDSFIFFTIKF